MYTFACFANTHVLVTSAAAAEWAVEMWWRTARLMVYCHACLCGGGGHFSYLPGCALEVVGQHPGMHP